MIYEIDSYGVRISGNDNSYVSIDVFIYLYTYTYNTLCVLHCSNEFFC